MSTTPVPMKNFILEVLEVDPSAPRYIQTVWGVGYVFVPDGSH